MRLKKLATFFEVLYICNTKKACLGKHLVEHIAQLVEHLTFNERVDGSSPSMLTDVWQYALDDYLRPLGTARVAELVDALL